MQGLRRKAEVLQYHKDNIEAELGRLRDACSRRGEHNDLMKLKLVVRAPCNSMAAHLNLARCCGFSTQYCQMLCVHNMRLK